MPEVIQEWLGTRLGVLLDLSPEKFGRNTKDGVLLSKLLYNYGVIPVHVLNKIKESKNFHDCYNNLIVLKPWLGYIGVTHDDSTLKQMAGGEGSSAISIFYAVYLNLERKDRLHYISAQKERRYTENSCTRRFKVDWVPEREVADSVDNSTCKLSLSLCQKNDMIEWHRAKCKEVVDIIKRTKEKFQKIMNKKKPLLGPIISKHTTSQRLDKRCLEALQTKEKIDAFEKKHIHECPDLNYSELLELKNTIETQPCVPVPNMEEAVNIVNNMKKRKKTEIYARNFQQNMQCMLLDTEWQKIINKQNLEFEDTVCANLLKQSQYEKQMINKLSLMRNQKKVLAENRKMIENLKMDLGDKDFDNVLLDNMEIKGEDWGDEIFEKERIAELHRRLYDEKARVRREQLKVETRKIVESLIDMSIRISEVRRLTGCQIPKALMKDMKELFFKDLSIFDILDNLEELHQNISKLNVNMNNGNGEGEEIIYKDFEKFEFLKNQEAKRQHCLDECDFNDYINLLGPWMIELLFPNSSETEVKHIVLGYIVHKLLELKYPVPNIPSPPAVNPMKPVAVVRGLYDDNGIKMLMDLMEACEVLVVRVDDAINYVLTVYKEELSVALDIDETFQKVTAKALKDSSIDLNEKDLKKKNQLLKKEELEKPLIPEEELYFSDKQTQTPRVIPEEDPLLTPNAQLGKLAFEALGAGDPVPDPVIVSAVVAYVVSKQDDYKGWILLNYPNLYSQASLLECALTGYQILPIIGEMDTLEDVEEFTYREPCVNPYSRDDFSNNRTSRLVPRPNIFIKEEPEIPKTYFDVFINMKKLPEITRKVTDVVQYPSAMERFYSDQEILNDFEYATLNFQVVKNLAKTVLGETTPDNNNLVTKSSVEIFGNIILELNEKWEPSKKKNHKAIEKETSGGTKKVKNKESSILIVKSNTEENEETIEEVDKNPKKPPDLPSSAKPGDPDWEWVSGVQPEVLQMALATLWENMEAVYIEDFKDVFFCLRVHRANAISYSTFIRESMQALMKTPDEKQKILSDFQQMFNEIDEDLRPDVDIKCELHVRVSELEQALMMIADERKMNSQKDRTKIAQDGWVADEMANLVNLYLTAVQLEADRCVDTCQVIMDYYISLQQKIPDEKPLEKIIVSKLQIRDRKYTIISSNLSKSISNSFQTPRNSDVRRSNRSILELGSRSNVDRVSKTRSWTDKKRRSSEDSFLTGAADVINNILVNLALPDDCMTPFHTFFIDNVQQITLEIKNILESCISETKKGEKVVAKNNKKLSETKVSSNGNLIAEWTTALENEMSRFLFRMKLILARGIFEINEFLTTILNVLSSLSEDITDMYLREINSISECCKVFRCAIEEEIPLQPQLELREDEFIVNENVLLFSNVEKELKIMEDDEHKKFRFAIEQLSLLSRKLQRVAPDGEIIKRSLVFILEDLRVRRPEDENSNCFPEIWNHIDANDLVVIIDEIYQDLEIVHWKDFIIYGLELPNPTETEILLMRKVFRSFDPLVTELITRENYNSINFWFETRLDYYSEVDRYEKAKDLLYRLYQVDEHRTNYSALLLALCKDKNPALGFTKALALALGKHISINETPYSLFSPLGEAFEGEDYEVFIEPDKNTVKKPYCCPSTSSEFIGKCIPRRKVPKCECPYFRQSSVSINEDEEEMASSFEEAGESGSLFYYDSKASDTASVTSVVPSNILSSLLKASFPSFPQLSILLDCNQTFQETLDSVVNSLESFDNSVDVHKLLHHNFIERLIQSTNKFKLINIQDVLLSLIERKNSGVQVACTSFDKLNAKYCRN